jgi:hypothetical protein
MNAAIFSDITSCTAYINQRSGGTYDLLLQGLNSTEQETSLHQVPSDMEVTLSSKTSVHIRGMQRYVPEDGNFHLCMCVIYQCVYFL